MLKWLCCDTFGDKVCGSEWWCDDQTYGGEGQSEAYLDTVERAALTQGRQDKQKIGGKQGWLNHGPKKGRFEKAREEEQTGMEDRLKRWPKRFMKRTKVNAGRENGQSGH